MQILHKVLFVVSLTFMVAVSSFAEPRVVLQAGHQGTPVAMAWHEDSRTVVSVGEDGRLLVTRPGDAKVLHRFHVGEGRILRMALDPSRERAALVQANENGSYSVSVWDWTQEKMVFQYTLDSDPLFLTWSARGRYLALGNLGSPSVVILEGRTGRRLSYLQRLPSLYNAGYIGSTETILMTYAGSGAIRYWDIRSSTLRLSAETLGNLSGVTVLQTGSKAALFAYRNDELYLINRQTGAVLDKLELTGLTHVSIDPTTGEVDALTQDLTGYTVHRLQTDDAGFTLRLKEEPTLTLPGDDDVAPVSTPFKLPSEIHPVSLLRAAGKSFLMTEDGCLCVFDGAQYSPVVDDQLWRPNDIAFRGNSLYLSGNGRLVRFNSEFFAEDALANINLLNDLNRKEYDSESQAKETKLTIGLEGQLILWDATSGGLENGIRVINMNDDGSERFLPTKNTIQNVQPLPQGKLLIVDRNGGVGIMDLSTGEVESEYAALGIMDAAYVPDEDYLLAGRSSAGRSGTPLESVDLATSESMPVNDERFMVYSVRLGPYDLYTIGIEGRGALAKTILKRHDLTSPERASSFTSAKGEDFEALVLPDPNDDAVFTTLGGMVRRLSSSRRTSYPWEERILDLERRGQILYGLDEDGAVIFWNVRTGRTLMRSYFFKDGGWLALPTDNDVIWASEGAIDNVVIYRDGRTVDPRRISRILKDEERL
ncbi:MAG: WD40 repeat domain-containing protein [Spirochaetales bacterium]|nr:WD40 repeat domain-containing protein [Spirochaetales bacterium]